MVVGEKRADEFETKLKPYYPTMHIKLLARPGNKTAAEKRAATILTDINNSKTYEITKNKINAVNDDLTVDEETSMSSSKLREAALKATPASIKFFIRHTAFGSLSENQARLLLNELRVGMGYRPITFTGFSGGTRRRRRITRKRR